MNRRRRNSNSASGSNNNIAGHSAAPPVAVPTFNRRSKNGLYFFICIHPQLLDGSAEGLDTMRALEQLRLGENQSGMSSIRGIVI